MAISPDHKILLTINSGPERFSVTAVALGQNPPVSQNFVAPVHHRERGEDPDEWRSVFMGAAFLSNHFAFISEGNSGRVRLIDVTSGERRKLFDLNQGGFSDSYTGDLAFDAARGLLYVLDQANFRLVILETKKGQVLASLPVGRLPFAISLSPDKKTAYVTNIGVFQYSPMPGADRKRPQETGLPFPAFGFPSPEAINGVRGIPGLGDPNVRESNSLYVINLEDAENPHVDAVIRTGKPFGNGVLGPSSPCGVLAVGDNVFVSNAHNDTVTVIDAKTREIKAEIAIRIPGLEDFRGVMPVGMAFEPEKSWLFVAEAGINAVGVIDVNARRVVGHIPTAWFPTRVLIDNENVYVSNVKGFGTGPNVYLRWETEYGFAGVMHRGSVSEFPVPDEASLAKSTAKVMEANGFVPQAVAPILLPREIRYLVLIVKENRTFDEVFGDIDGIPALARFGMRGYASGGKKRLSLKQIAITPNHHEIAKRWTISDNFYADSEVSVDGHHWLVDTYPDIWTESSLMASYTGGKDYRFPTTAPGRLLFAESNSSVHPEEQGESGTLWHHLERNGISFRNFGEGFELAGNQEEPGEKPTGARFLTNVPMPQPLYQNTSREYPGFNMNIPDQFRADAFIREVTEKYVTGGEPFPRFIFIHLPNDHMAQPRPEDGYPFSASYVADNDYALGRILEFLSNSQWWKEMAVFVTEDDAQGGRDHIDSHRTVLMAAGPYMKRDYISHVHSSFPGLLKTIFRIFRMPPLNLYDAAASDLSDCFTYTPDFTPYKALPVDERVFDPAQARDPLDGKPGPRMDDPGVVRELQ